MYPRHTQAQAVATKSILRRVARALNGSPFERRVYLVGGAVRDELLGKRAKQDLDLVVLGDALEVARLLHAKGVAESYPAVYPRFGTAMVRARGLSLEFASARRESYAVTSRKPKVAPATLEEDAERRDFTVNALLKCLWTSEILDPTGQGLADLAARTLRTPREPGATFHDDPLRMLRAVRFRSQLGFEPAPGLYAAIREESDRLGIVSAERIRDEFLKMLALDDVDQCLADIRDLDLMRFVIPELAALPGVQQSGRHYLDVWDHTLAVVRATDKRDIALRLAALLHDVAKPQTRTVEQDGRVRFIGHERLGAEIAGRSLRRLRIPQKQVQTVQLLVRHHMRLAMQQPPTDTALRRLIRDLGAEWPRLISLMQADAKGMRRGTAPFRLVQVRRRLDALSAATPPETLASPLSGDEIMRVLGVERGPAVGRHKAWLEEQVIVGSLAPDDKAAAERMLLAKRNAGG